MVIHSPLDLSVPDSVSELFMQVCGGRPIGLLHCVCTACCHVMHVVEELQQWLVRLLHVWVPHSRSHDCLGVRLGRSLSSHSDTVSCDRDRPGASELTRCPCADPGGTLTPQKNCQPAYCQDLTWCPVLARLDMLHSRSPNLDQDRDLG